MSSSEGENFDLDNISESEFEDDYAPAKKVSDENQGIGICSTFSQTLEQKTAAKPKAVPKTTTKAKVTTNKATTKPKASKKVLVDRDDNAEEEEEALDNSDNDVSHASVRKIQAGPAKKKTASETYKKVCNSPAHFGRR
jgi:DNA topoisomerase-2